MNPVNKGPAKFYELFKVHKSFEPGDIPPERPIVSCNGSITENIGKFVQNFLKEVSNTHSSFVQDSPDFLRCLEADLNDQDVIEDDDIIVTVDVKSLYTNVPISESLILCREALDQTDNKPELNDFIIKLLELVMSLNIFEFNGELFKQEIGLAMGQKPAPDVANIVMAAVDVLIKNLAKESFTTTMTLKFYKRFLDDIFMVVRGKCSVLHDFLKKVNLLHPTLKFTMEHTKTENNCDCECKPLTKIPFLDTQCQIEEGKMIVDLYRKPTDRNMYLLTSSCHPSQVCENIPYSLALRIVRICSKPEDRDKRLDELKQLLLNRDYKLNIINSAISKAKNIPRSEALKRVVKPPTNRPVFPVTHHPSLPSIPKIVNHISRQVHI